jgi:hypothetical protein
MPNTKVYIHEFIDILGPNRAKYMHHMTANWVPTAIRERNQLCYGVWGTVGSTGRWPEVVNLWELDGWDGLAANFEHELSHPSLQDPSLAEWWAAAADLRRGGRDRILVPAPWTRTINELVADGARGVVYAHDLVTVPAGRAPRDLDALRDIGQIAVESRGLELIGAFATALVNDNECVVIWSVPDWNTWAAFESDPQHEQLAPWRAAQSDLGADWQRTLMVDAPLAPLRIGRQPTETDRRLLSEL